jgi:hypothetical protein
MVSRRLARPTSTTAFSSRKFRRDLPHQSAPLISLIIASSFVRVYAGLLRLGASGRARRWLLALALGKLPAAPWSAAAQVLLRRRLPAPGAIQAFAAPLIDCMLQTLKYLESIAPTPLNASRPINISAPSGPSQMQELV